MWLHEVQMDEKKQYSDKKKDIGKNTHQENI
jgi:hypothetical protein